MGHTTKAIFTALLLTLTLGAQEKEKKITKKEVPPAVLSAFQKSYPKATIKGIAEERKDGKIYYEIESLDGKTSRDLLYQADGSVAEIEEGMAFADLPEAIKTTVNSKYPKAKITEVEKVLKGTDVSYGVALKSAKGKVELSLDASGKVLQEKAPGTKKK